MLLTKSSLGVFPSDKPERSEEDDGKPRPNEYTSFLASVSLAILVITITSLNILLTNAWTHLAAHEAWAIFVACLIGFLIITSVMVLERQPKNKATFPFMVPCVPYLPLLSVFVNILLIVKLNYWTYVRFGVWMFIGMEPVDLLSDNLVLAFAVGMHSGL